MKKNDLAERLASRTRITTGAAADQLDQIVHHIIQSLKEGRAAVLPGLGVFAPANRKPGFRFQSQFRRAPKGRAKS